MDQKAAGEKKAAGDGKAAFAIASYLRSPTSRGNRTPASFHAWLLECTSEHQPDSSRPLCLDKHPPELPVLSWLLLACGETLWETLGEPLGEPLGGTPRGTLGEILRVPPRKGQGAQGDICLSTAAGMSRAGARTYIPAARHGKMQGFDSPWKLG